ncbi:MAG: right-handed parallel beta-helix repeat-containing protein [candidate division Zixibacteria bacterium]|nr:right-handed parallel beta-helix repeat-containing protein [candidate division Zixibacteria bacterium]
MSPDDQPTIQAGIDAAIQGDTVLVADGTYTGPGNRDINFSGKGVVLKSENGPEVTIIDCQGDSLNPRRGFNFNSGEDTLTKIEGLQIINGFSVNFSLYNIDQGGAVRCFSSSPVIRNCLFSSNSSVRGGAIYCKNSASPLIESCEFSNNFSYHYGGSLYCEDGGNPVVSNCAFNNCSSGAHAGSICIARSSPTIRNCVLLRPIALQNGGAVFIQDDSKPIFEGCTFYGASGGTGSSFFINQRPGKPSPTEPLFSKCIISFGTGDSAFYISGAAPSFLCTNIFGTIEGDWSGPIASQFGIDGNFSLNPRFCDTASDTLSLISDSPCLPELNSCLLLIGAIGSGCSCCDEPGDADDNSDVNVGDATYIVKYIFQSGTAPPCCDQSDADGGGDVNIGDANFIVEFIFQSGAAPICPNPGLLACP